ncbi:unnamed protein product [Bathycoccus prasinos]|mmetsp:Transcript_3042/g.10864  ORF Transcript_3042/g.10864 Transcript_3042/m.10864 type:complete len:627 (-) Transcript_3042:2249-4129(-)
MAEESNREETITGATAVWRVAESHGVTHVFANPGTTEMHFVGAFESVRKIEPILTLHETVASGAADGYARVKKGSNVNIPGVTLLHLGPGLMNASANLHNAHRAGSSVVNVVGDMSTWHSGTDPVLESSIADIAKINGAVVSSKVPAAIAADAKEAFVTATRNSTSPGASKVVTLIVPHDRSWERVSKVSVEDVIRGDASPLEQLNEDREQKSQHLQSPEQATTKGCVAERMHAQLTELLDEKEVPPPFTTKTTFRSIGLTSQSSIRYASMLREEFKLDIQPTIMYDYSLVWDLVLYIEDRLAIENKNSGGENSFSPASSPTRESADVGKKNTSHSHGLSEPVQKAINAFGKSFVKSILKSESGKVGVYLGGDAGIRENLERVCGIFRKLGISEDSIYVENAFSRIDRGGDLMVKRCPYFPRDAMATLASFETLVLVDAKKPVAMFGYKDQNFSSLIRQGEDDVWEIEAPPGGKLTADAFSPQFTHLTLTGGAIGFGLSAAVGAAVADRSRKVIAFQADGSGLYDCQALWTMARYNLNVCVVICNNSSYNILNIENAMQRVEDANKTNVSKSLTSLGDPTIDWVTMAKSFGFRMATRCDTIESFQMVFQEAMEKNGDGPILVEAVL